VFQALKGGILHHGRPKTFVLPVLFRPLIGGFQIMAIRNFGNFGNFVAGFPENRLPYI